MKVVNLSRRPFTNRRPVQRLAMFFWIIGGLLLLVNAWLYFSHFSGSSKGRGRLDVLARQVAQEEDRLSELWNELKSLNLDSRNRKARYLNSLIHTRTFPWSALFDDLEQTLPIDVYLGSVKPSLRLAKDGGAKVAAAAAQSRRATTAREARARARARARGESPPEVVTAVEEPEVENLFSGDRVSLTIKGFARNDEALFELVDRLYQSPSFKDPDLSREAADKTGKINFNMRVVYLTPKRNANPPEEGTLAAELAMAADAGSASVTPGGTGITGGEAVGSVDSDGQRIVSTGTAPSGDPGAVTRVGTEDRPVARSSRSRARDVRRAEPQRRRAGLPPEEGEQVAAGDNGRRRSRTQGSRSSNTRAPSTVSVAPGFIPAAPAAGGQAPVAQGGPGTQQPATQTPTTTTPNRPGQPSNPSTTQPSTGSGNPSTGGGGGADPGTNPTPTTPSASSSPQLQGSVFDKWLPDFLRWTPDYSKFMDQTEEVAG